MKDIGWKDNTEGQGEAFRREVGPPYRPSHMWGRCSNCGGLHRNEGRLCNGCIEDAIATIPATEAEVAQWMKECDEGKHPLSPQDEAALERSREKLFKKLKTAP